MKKKVLLVLSVMAILACLFAVSVSAADFTSGFAGEVTEYDSAPDWANVEDKVSTAVIKKADGTTVRVPAYYVFKANGNNSFDSKGSNFDFGWISEKIGEVVTLANLVAIEIPYGTVSTGVIDTSYFSALEEIVVPTTVTSLPQKMLRGNAVIKRMFVKQSMGADGKVVGVTSIPAYFADQEKYPAPCSLEFFALELNYVTAIGGSAFNKTQVTELVFEGPFTEIAGSAFGSCPNLRSVTLNNTGDIIAIGGKAFAYSSNLTSVTMNGISLTDYLFENVNGLTGGLTVIATNVGRLGQMSFKNATNLERVEISGPMTSFGSSTFSGCSNLKTVIATNTSETPATCSGVFAELKAIENVTLHNIQIGYRMFYKVTTLKTLTLTGNYTEIGQEAFAQTPITSFTIPAGFTSIGHRAFQNCASLTTITFAGNAAANATIGDAVFENCTSLTTLGIPEGVVSLGNCVCNRAGLVTLSLPSTLTTLTGNSHFAYNKLTTVTGLENTSITTIPYSMFRGVSTWRPEVIKLPNTVTSIGQYGMADVGAQVFILGAAMEDIGVEAFVNCPNVKAFYIPSTVTSIGNSAFKNSKTNNILFFVTSNDSTYLETIKTGTASSDIVAYSVYESASADYATGRHIISECNKCVAFHNGVHAWKGEDEIMLDSYFEEIGIGDSCEVCNLAEVKSTIEALFVSKGVSAKTFGDDIALVQGYEINRAAIGTYKNYVADFDFGILAYANNGGTACQPKPGEGKVVDIVFDNMANDYIEVKLTGVPQDCEDVKLVFCAYVTEGESIYYLDDGETLSSIIGKSYNDIVG